MDIITLKISRDLLETFYEVLEYSIDPSDHDTYEYIEVLNVIELALGKNLTALEDEDEDSDEENDDDSSGDLDG